MSDETWVMTYGGPMAVLSTPYGDINALWTDGGHCFLTTDRHHDFRECGKLRYRSQGYRIGGLHLFAASGWDENPCDPEISNHRAQFAPALSRAAIVAAVSKTVQEFTAAHPAVLPAAEVRHLGCALKSAQEAGNEARGLLEAARRKTQALCVALDRARAELRRAQAKGQP